MTDKTNPMKSKHDRTREQLLRKIRQLQLAENALAESLGILPIDTPAYTHQWYLLRGYRLCLRWIKELA